MNFARLFRIPILYNICEWLFLVLARIDLVWCAANLSMFFINVCKSVFEVLGCSFQLILHWWAPNQRTNVGNAMQVITEVYFDTQTSARGNTGILPVWLTSFKRCIRACKRTFPNKYIHICIHRYKTTQTQTNTLKKVHTHENVSWNK